MADILLDVQQRGDAAVLYYTARFDGLQACSLAALELTQAELKTAFDALPEAQRSALEFAARRVRSYHQAQRKASGAACLQYCAALADRYGSVTWSPSFHTLCRSRPLTL